MNKSKNILAFALILVFMLSLSVSAFADGAKNANDYINALKELDGATCSNEGTISFGNDKYERVNVNYTGELSEYESNFSALFSEDGSEVIFYMTLLQFSEDKLADVLVACNDINARSTSVKVYADTSDNTVTCELYLLLTDESTLDLSLTGTGLFIGYTDSAYEQLANYAA